MQIGVTNYLCYFEAMSIRKSIFAKTQEDGDLHSRLGIENLFRK